MQGPPLHFLFRAVSGKGLNVKALAETRSAEFAGVLIAE
jgi:hypothetical protein